MGNTYVDKCAASVDDATSVKNAIVAYLKNITLNPGHYTPSIDTLYGAEAASKMSREQLEAEIIRNSKIGISQAAAHELGERVRWGLYKPSEVSKETVDFMLLTIGSFNIHHAEEFVFALAKMGEKRAIPHIVTAISESRTTNSRDGNIRTPDPVHAFSLVILDAKESAGLLANKAKEASIQGMGLLDCWLALSAVTLGSKDPELKQMLIDTFNNPHKVDGHWFSVPQHKIDIAAAALIMMGVEDFKGYFSSCSTGLGLLIKTGQESEKAASSASGLNNDVRNRWREMEKFRELPRGSHPRYKGPQNRLIA